VSHEALTRRWRRLSDPTRGSEEREPRGWLWREFEDGQRWRALAVQAQVYKHDRSATLSPATTAAYELWWPEHTSDWAARYVRDKDRAIEEYHEVEDLWEASLSTLKDDELGRLKREQKLRRRAQLFGRIAGTLLISVLLAFMGLLFFYSQAEQQKKHAQISETRLLNRV